MQLFTTEAAGMPPLPSPLLALRCAGMVTPIGNSASQTVASWIAQTRRMRRVQLDGFADPFTIADCHGVDNGQSGVERLALLLASAVAEAFDGAHHLAAHAAAHPSAECLEILVLPSWLAEEDCKRIGVLLSTWLAPYPTWTGQTRARLVVPAASCGAWTALEYAYRALAHNPRLQHVMIAAVDSACEPAILRQAAQADWLFRPGNAQGYVPGEAAACVLLQRAGNINLVPADTFAVHRPALVHASARLWPADERPDAAPLSQALSGALRLAGMQAIHISDLESDMDGSDWRSTIEGDALDRVLFSETTTLPQWRPATLLGQVGAAGGLIGWLLPALLHGQKIERVNTVLNWSIEPGGEIAACVLERSPN